MKTRTQIQIKGIVQGVGFRPFVFALAEKNSLCGQVLNNAFGVLIDVEGDEEKIEKFISEIELNAPPLARIDSLEYKNSANGNGNHFTDFRIVESDSSERKFTPISADIATCADCLRELFDPNNRRFRYPFINCTNCGPRFTIIENVPYDRENTTMREFAICAECRAEYENPVDRRFHAEPICCSNCGPKVLLSPKSEVQSSKQENSLDFGLWTSDFGLKVRRLLQSGKILAVKGIGGFHLVCDAANAEAVETLRRRKYREDKPFALMADSVETIEKYCCVSEPEKELLESKERPIVLLEKKINAPLVESVAPKSKHFGFMLPYAPLHFLLLENLETPLVMTSANVSDEPICFEDADAANRLNKIADYFLTHNRRIHIRTDDSIARVSKDELRFANDELLENPKFQIPNFKFQIVRRSRGFAPAPVKTAFRFEQQILACGAELKNTFCLAKNNYAFLSHHIGDLENLETLKSFTTGIEHYKNLFNLQPEIIAYDLHPEYLSTKYAFELEAEKIGVQHHHAHLAACLADNFADGEVIGAAFDGSGFGTDGKIWGGEFFVADFKFAERVFHLEYVPLAGGAQAIREPWRMAAVYLHKTFGDDFLNLDLPFVKNLNLSDWKSIKSMIAGGVNCPETSSIGRLFDAMASLLSLRKCINYEGQAAVELEAMSDKNETNSYEFEIDGSKIIKSDSVIKSAVEDLLSGVSASKIAARFHQAMANLIGKIAVDIRAERNLNRVALSGGVFQNAFLLEKTCQLLRKANFEILTHKRVPANDGGIALGQAAVANALCQNRSY